MPSSLKQFFLLIGLTCALVGCRGPLKPGLDALAEGNYSKAQKHARSGLHKDRQDPELNLLMADALVGAKQYQAAEPYARRAYENESLRGRAGRTLGKVLWELDDTIEALRVWRSARDVDPALVPDDDYVRALERAVDVAEKEADPETELEFRLELGRVNSEHPEATAGQVADVKQRVAEALVREGNYESAVSVYEELTSEQPEQSSHPFERGRLLARLGEDKRAIAAFEEFIAIGEADKRHQRIHDVAVKAETIGAFSVAVHFYEEAIAALPAEPSRRRARIHRRVGQLLLSTGIKDLGERHLRSYVEDMTAVGGDPISAEIYMSAATVASGNRHPDFALELLEEAATKAGPSWRATRSLAELYARRARTPDVERVLRLYVERAPHKSRAKIVVGEWASNRRSFELARFFLESAVNEDKKVSPDVWLQLARVYSALGYMDEVRRCLNTYTSKAPDKRRALLDVATIYRAQRMYDEAQKALAAALKAEPKDLLVVKLLEDLYREWGRPKKIHEVYDKWAKARGNKPGDFQLIGERFFRQQEWDNALPYLTKAAKAGEHDAWLQVADIYNRQRKERDMKEALDRYLEASTDRARALNSVLQRYRVSNWNYEAIPILEELIKLEPRNLLHYEKLSGLYFEQGRDVEAFELWKRFIALADNPAAALETMARRFQREHHQDWMLQFLHQVLDREGKPDPRIYKLLGDTYADVFTNNRRRTTARAQSIFTQENKARKYYTRYLEEAAPSRGDLQTFAESMKQKGFWNIAARTYEKLGQIKKLQSHQVLNYGIVLLNLGEADKAEEQFRQFYEDRQKSVDAASAVSEELMRAKRYASAEPYLRAMLQNGDDALVRQAFMKLAEVYRNSDQQKKIAGLKADFLDRSQDPQDARRIVRDVLEGAGMWEQAAQELETMAQLQDEVGFELGMNLYRAGQRDRADDAFREYAGQNLNPGEAWSRVGEFYESRGEVEKARNAYQNAANASPQNEVVHAELGRYLILTGRIDEGRASFERARSNVPHGQRGSLYRTEVEVLLNTGHHAQARAAARDAIAVAYLDRDYFYSVIAPTELASGDPVRSQRMVDELVNANLPLAAVVLQLRQAGYVEEAAALIDKEIVSGDHILGGDVLIQNASMFGAIGGVARLMRTAQPLLERSNRDVRVPRDLGNFLVAEGHIEDGAMLLRQALELGDTTLAATLAELYAALGHHGEAFEMLQAHLASTPDAGVRRGTLMALGYRYEVLGEGQRFRDLLEHLARDERFAAEAIPFLVRYLTESGEVALVVDMVERLTATPAVSNERPDEPATDIAVAALIAGVEELAIAGFDREAQSLLETAPAGLGERDQIRDLRLRMAAFSTGENPEAEFRRALEELGESNTDAWQRLRVAELALAAGRYPLATEIATGAFRSTDFSVRAGAFRIALRAARAADDLESVDNIVKAFLEETEDRMSARATAYNELSQLGLDRRALLIAEEQASKVPIYGYVRDALGASQQFGDPARINTWARRLIEVDRQNPSVALQHTAYQWTLRQDERLNAPMRKLLEGTYDQMLFGINAEIFDLYRRGEPFDARERLIGYLEDTKYDPESVEQALVQLSSYKLWGEVARVVAPRVPDGGLSVRSRRLVGLANMSMGFDSDGLRQLDKAIEAAPDAAHEATLIADGLLLRRRYESALRYAELAVEKRPNRPAGRNVRGLARIAVGDISGAKEDLDGALLAGIGRTHALYRAGVIALRTGHDDVAEHYLEELLTGHDASHGDHPRFVVNAYEAAGRAADGVKYIEAHRPQIASGQGIAGSALVASLAQLYESAGSPDRSFAIYQSGIRRMQFTDPVSEQLATFRNNLAYTFSTTNQRVPEGIDLVLRAIAQHRDRQAVYIDTLGWLYYRQGKLELAEAEIRRAIRSTRGRTSELDELYEHLATLRAEQGYHGQAVWHQIFADSVQPLRD